MADHPFICRIAGWDLDSREWILGILILPLLWMTSRVIKIEFAKLFRPLRESLVWGASVERSEAVISCANMELLQKLLPDRHAGTLVLKQPIATLSKQPGAMASASALKRAGIPHRTLSSDTILIAPDDARRLMQRLGGEPRYAASYIFFREDAAEVERQLTEQLAERKWAEVPRREWARFYYVGGAFGPMDGSDRSALFEDLMWDRLERLYGGAMPGDVPAVNFAALFNSDPSEGIYRIMLERRKAGPRIWLRKEGASESHLAECMSGRWRVEKRQQCPKLICGQLAKRIRPEWQASARVAEVSSSRST